MARSRRRKRRNSTEGLAFNLANKVWNENPKVRDTLTFVDVLSFITLHLNDGRGDAKPDSTSCQKLTRRIESEMWDTAIIPISEPGGVNQHNETFKEIQRQFAASAERFEAEGWVTKGQIAVQGVSGWIPTWTLTERGWQWANRIRELARQPRQMSREDEEIRRDREEQSAIAEAIDLSNE